MAVILTDCLIKDNVDFRIVIIYEYVKKNSEEFMKDADLYKFDL